MTEAQKKLIIDLFTNWDEHGYPKSDINYIKSLILDGYEFADITEKYSKLIRQRKENLEQLQYNISELESDLEDKDGLISDLELKIEKLEKK